MKRFTAVTANLKLMFDAWWLVATTAVTSGFGFIFWWVAARWFPASAVGLGSAAISAMTLLGTLGMLGLGTLLMGELPLRRRGEAPSLVTSALVVAGIVGGVLGLVFAVAAPLFIADLRPLGQSVAAVVLFAAGTSLTAMVLVLDQASLGVNRAALQFGRNLIFSLVKLIALFAVALWFSARFGLTIYLTWLIGNAVSMVFLVLNEALKGRLSLAYRPQLELLSGLRDAAIQHHLLNLLLIGPGLVLPLVVTAFLSATSNAYFYAAWMMFGFVNVIPVALSTVLYSAASANPDQLQSKLRFTLGLAALAGAVANLGILILGHPLLQLFGAVYAQNATATLTVLSIGVFPLIINDHYVAICRVNREPALAIRPMAIGAVLKVALGAFGAVNGGLLGLSIGVVASDCLVTLFVAPAVYRVIAGRRVAVP